VDFCLAVRVSWRVHHKDRAFARLAAHCHVAAHHARELARDGQAEPCAAEALRGGGKSPRDPKNKKGRLALVEEAVEKVYKHYGDDQKKRERIALGAAYRDRYDSISIEASDPPFTYFIGVWDTVRALGIPGSSDLVFWRRAFHDATLNPHVPYARQALSIDENRQIFAPDIWDEVGRDGRSQGARSYQAGLVPGRPLRRRRRLSRDGTIRFGLRMDGSRSDGSRASADGRQDEAEIEALI
jgi:hypothetical protein